MPIFSAFTFQMVVPEHTLTSSIKADIAARERGMIRQIYYYLLTIAVLPSRKEGWPRRMVLNVANITLLVQTVLAQA